MARLIVIEKVIEKTVTVGEAGIVLGLSNYRQVLRLKKGANAIVYGNRGREPANAIEDKIKKQAVNIKTI